MAELISHISELTEKIKENENPFEADELERNSFNSFFCNLLKSYKSATIALNGDWGSGKTTFFTMCKASLEKEKYKTLYLNAWENDTLNSPMVCIAGTLQELNTKSSTEYNELICNLDKVAPKILKGALFGLTKLFVGGQITDEIVDQLKEIGNSTLQDSVNSFKEQKGAREQMKENLKNYINSVSKDKPVIFFIDELDRCRPDFAVELLENIKHLFSIENIVFVIAIDKVQLCSSIKGYYGSDTFNACEYLKRFFELEIKLPKGSKKRFIENRLNKIYLPKTNLSNQLYRNGYNGFFEFLCEHLTLRDLDRLFAELSIIVIGCQYKGENLEFIIFLLFLKLHYPDDYEIFKSRSIDWFEFLDKCINIFALEKIEDSTLKKVLSYLILKLMIVYCNEWNLPEKNKKIDSLRSKLPEIDSYIDNEIIFYRNLCYTSEIIEYTDQNIY